MANGQLWTDEELAIVDAHPEMTAKALAELLPGRTKAAVGGIRKFRFAHHGDVHAEQPPVKPPGEYLEAVSGFLADDWECLAIWCKWNGYAGCRELSRDKFDLVTLLCTSKLPRSNMFKRGGRPADPRKIPGRYDIQPLENDPEWKFYWHAFIGDLRVNGGLARSRDHGRETATRAIVLAREELLAGSYYWDTETFSWVPKGELPPVS